MSTTIYDSPDMREPVGGVVPQSLSIDVTHGTVWFFNYDEDGEPVSVTVALSELPHIWQAIGEYLEAEGYVYRPYGASKKDMNW